MDKNKDGFITKGELKLAKKSVGMKVNYLFHITYFVATFSRIFPIVDYYKPKNNFGPNP